MSEWLNQFVYQSSGMMMHPGLPVAWVEAVLLALLLLAAWVLSKPGYTSHQQRTMSLVQLPGLGRLVQGVVSQPWLQLVLRLVLVGFFITIIVAGLFGTPVPERNAATVLTWTVWWTGLIIAVYFTGSAWCAICPWDALATWLVRRRWWQRGDVNSSMNIRVPRMLRSIWPALWMFIGLTWLELGVGITTNPYATALLAMLMLVLTTASLVIFERKAFCRYFCAIGRTIGMYAELAPVAVRPVDYDTCAKCKTLECFHGTDEIEPCPTHLVMGRIKQNTYCTSCGACSQSCPYQNVAWRLRSTGAEAIRDVRPHWDEAWFMLGLLSLTSFHGITMMPFWEQWVRSLAVIINDSGQLLASFSIGMFASMLVPVILYTGLIQIVYQFGRTGIEFKRLFSSLAIPMLPLAFTYHIAHNLNHLLRESRDLSDVVMNPLGQDTLPLSMAETHFRHLNPLLPENVIFTLQAGLMLVGFWLAVRIMRSRISRLSVNSSTRRLISVPVLLFLTVITVFNLWLLMQPMIMRM